MMQVVVSVQYQVMKNHFYDAFYRLTEPRSQITSYVFDVVRATVPTIHSIDGGKLLPFQCDSPSGRRHLRLDSVAVGTWS